MQPIVANQPLSNRSLGFAFGAMGLVIVGLLTGIATDNLWVLAVPFAIGVGYLCFVRMDIALLTITAVTPFSILYDHPSGTSFFLPTEPLMVGLMLTFLLKTIIEARFDGKVATHPLSLIQLAIILWMLMTTLSSVMPLASAKFVLMRLWAVVCFFYLGSQVFRSLKNIRLFFVLMILGTIPTIFYAWQRHAGEYFSLESSSWVLDPFHINHGEYAAVLAMLLPFSVAATLRPGLFKMNSLTSILAGLVTVILVIALVLSYTRAAWLGVAGAVGFGGLMMLRLKFRWLFLAFVLIASVGLYKQQEIRMALSANRTVSNDDLGEHVRSIGNIQNDASNLERINRWESSFRMFEQRPFLGWGPGTYMFQYAPFQKPWEKTFISTNAHTLGGIHSEYFGPLVEMGVLGFLLWIGFVLISLRTGMNLFYDHEAPWVVRILALCITLALITYYVHGLMNNYLDLDKTAILFWALCGMLLALAAHKHQFGDSRELAPTSRPQSPEKDL